MRKAFEGEIMGWVKNIAGLGLAVGVFGAVAGLWGPDDIKDATKRGVDGGFAVGEGIAEAVPDNVERILEEKGYDVEEMTAEDWANAAADKTIQWGDAGARFLTTYAERLGLDMDTVINIDGRSYSIGDCRSNTPHPACDFEDLGQD